MGYNVPNFDFLIPNEKNLIEVGFGVDCLICNEIKGEFVDYWQVWEQSDWNLRIHPILKTSKKKGSQNLQTQKLSIFSQI